MNFALTTRWNAGRHSDGEAMLNEILDLGFTHVELGYDTSLALIPGIKAMVEQKSVHVDSLHNFCPVPMGTIRAHPEIFTMADPDRRIRESAIKHTSNTVRMAQELGAKAVVCHAGNVVMKQMTRTLIEMIERGERHTRKFEKTRLKLHDRRANKGQRQLTYLYESLERMMPVLLDSGVRLALEILPTWEAIPTETEFEDLFRTFDQGCIGYWHDIGHSQIRQNLGFINMERWLEKLKPHLIGFHLHDVRPPGQDHLMPPQGDIDFSRVAKFGNLDVLRVIEPTTRTPKEDIVEGYRILRECWGNAPSGAESSAREG